MSFRLLALVLVAWAAGCAREPARVEWQGKPGAPVEVRLEARGRDVTLVATATVDVAELELVLDGRSARFGATAAGVSRRVVMRVTGDRQVVGVARAAGRSRAAVLEVGSPRTATPAPVTTIVELPGQGRVAEVRP